MIELIDDGKRESHDLNGTIEEGNGVYIESERCGEEEDSCAENIIMHKITSFHE